MPPSLGLVLGIQLSVVQLFLSLLNSKIFGWKMTRSFEKETSKGVYYARNKVILLEGSNISAVQLKMIGNSRVPPKVCFFGC